MGLPLDELAIGIVKVASLSLLTNAASSLSLALRSCSYIKGKIMLALKKKEKGVR